MLCNRITSALWKMRIWGGPRVGQHWAMVRWQWLVTGRASWVLAGRGQSWNVLKEAAVKLELFHACASCGHQSIPFISFVQGLFRIAAGASKLKKLKAALDCSTSQLDEFYSDPHAVAGMGSALNPKQVSIDRTNFVLFRGWSPQLNWEKWQVKVQCTVWHRWVWGACADHTWWVCDSGV